MRAKVILSISKDEFCGLTRQNPLEITLRQAQDDFSLATKYGSYLILIPKPTAHTPHQS